MIKHSPQRAKKLMEEEDDDDTSADQTADSESQDITMDEDSPVGVNGVMHAQ